MVDLVAGFLVCDSCGNILPVTDTLPYCDYKCNLMVIPNKNKSTSKRRKIYK